MCPEPLPFTLNKLLAWARDWHKETPCLAVLSQHLTHRIWESGGDKCGDCIVDVLPKFWLVNPVTLPCLQIGIWVRKLAIRFTQGGKRFRKACFVSRVCSSDGVCACELQACSPCKDQMFTELGQLQTKWLKSHMGCWLCGWWHSYSSSSVRDTLVTTGR